MLLNKLILQAGPGEKLVEEECADADKLAKFVENQIFVFIINCIEIIYGLSDLGGHQMQRNGC